MNPMADTGLRQRLELLRLRGARQRLDLSLALDDLAREAGGLRRGGAMVLAALRWLSARRRDAGAAGTATDEGRMSTLLNRLQWILPLFGVLFPGSPARRVARLRKVLDAGAVLILVHRLLKRAPQAPAEEPSANKNRP